MKYSRKQLARATVELLQEKGIEHTAEVLAAYLVENSGIDRSLLMKDIADLAQDKGILNVTIESARPLPEASKESIAEYLMSITNTKTYVVDEVIKPEHIGGARARTPHVEVDWTVAGKLRTLKRGAY